MSGLRVILLLLTLMAACSATWVEENLYEDTKTVPDDVISSHRRHLLLSVLINLDRMYRNANNEVGSVVDRGSNNAEDGFRFGLDTSLLKNMMEEDKGQPSKRGRGDVSGVLPPFGELCRAMHLGGCSHSRHK